MLSTLAFAAEGRQKVFAAITYDGNNIAKDVGGVGFKPDFAIVADRVNSNRKPMSASTLNLLSPQPYVVFPNDYYDLASSPANYYRDTGGNITSWNVDGVGIGSGDAYNKAAVSGNNFAGWFWKRHEDCFNILQYTGDGGSSKAIAHGLTSAPKLILGRRIDTSARDIYVYHVENTANPETDYLILNSSNATADLDTVWADTAPDSTNITVGTTLNGNGLAYNLFAFAEKAGVSKFGEYTGNGSATGPIISGLGFIPSLVMIKRTDAGSSHWTMFDRARKNPGVENYYIALEDTAAEFSGVGVLLGTVTDTFQPVSDNANTNANGGTYIWSAWA